MLRRSLTAAAVATLLGAATSAGAPAAATRPALYWRSAPPSGAHVLLDAGPRTLRLSAAAANRRVRVRLTLLGATPVQLTGRAGNPAVATLRFPPARDLRLHTYVVTVVARTLDRHRLAISRTVIVGVRSGVASLVGPGMQSRWAYVLHGTPARVAPRPRARVVSDVPTTTSDAQPNVVRTLAWTRGWVRIALTALPNGRTGWVPRSSLSVYHVVHTRLVVDTHRLVLSLLRDGRRVFHAPIGVGAARWPTPHGTFYVRERLTNFHDPFYGPVAFGTSARSPTLTDWPGGGIVGIHGTNAPGRIPGRISHGCIRLRNADILRLARLLPLGTPIQVR